eukprot:6179287-Pleurochrysis_carterae.AAC.1
MRCRSSPWTCICFSAFQKNCTRRVGISSVGCVGGVEACTCVRGYLGEYSFARSCVCLDVPLRVFACAYALTCSTWTPISAVWTVWTAREREPGGRRPEVFCSHGATTFGRVCARARSCASERVHACVQSSASQK